VVLIGSAACVITERNPKSTTLARRLFPGVFNSRRTFSWNDFNHTRFRSYILFLFYAGSMNRILRRAL